MRYLFAIGTIAAMLAGGSVQAQEAKLGDYGYGHMELHESGVVDQLRKESTGSCCDNIGECRKTVIRINQSTRQPEALLDGVWCPVTTTVHKDISLPMDTQAVVCAGKSSESMCPTTYCAAQATGS